MALDGMALYRMALKLYNQYINSDIAYDRVQSSIMSSASTKVKNGTKPNVTKSKVLKKARVRTRYQSHWKRSSMERTVKIL